MKETSVWKILYFIFNIIINSAAWNIFIIKKLIISQLQKILRIMLTPKFHYLYMKTDFSHYFSKIHFNITFQYTSMSCK